jgi:hypothetical protein
LRLQRLLEAFFAKSGTHQALICASRTVSELLVASGPKYDLYVFVDLVGREADVKHFNIGFDGFIYLLADGRSVIKHAGNKDERREYIAWGGELEFDNRALFNDVYYTIEIDDEGAQDKEMEDLEVSAEGTFNEGEGPTHRKSSARLLFLSTHLTARFLKTLRHLS